MSRLGLSLRSLFGIVLLACPLLAADKEPMAAVMVDKEKRIVIIDAKIAPRKMEDPKFQGKIYPIEVIACWPYPKGQKAHETLVTIDIKPSEVHKALESLGLKPGTPVMGEGKEPKGPEVSVYLQVPGPDGKPKRIPIERALLDPKTNKQMPKVKWRFTGSSLSKPDASKDATVYGADLTGTLIAVFPVTSETVLQTNLKFEDQQYLRLETDTKLLPKEGTAVKLVIEAPAGKP
jgi:hypothetical protein